MTIPTINALLLALPALLMIGCQGTRPANLGVQEGRLAACPDTPNCVSSFAPDDAHRVAPLPFSGAADDAMARLAAVVHSLPRTAVVTTSGTYLHVEFTSFLFRFVDDVEFLADDAAKVIHVRSASRLGKSDLGVNGQRIEKIRNRWQQTAPPP
jgi:uncharacterized protein (DUF1499 family)